MVAENPNRPVPPRPHREVALHRAEMIEEAERLEKKSAKFSDKARDLRQRLQPSIVIELRSDGLVVLSGWADGRWDSAYAPMLLSDALEKISALALEIQQPTSPSSPDEHAH